MREQKIERITDSVLLLFPLGKRLLKGDPSDPALAPFKNQSYQILRMLEKRGPLPMSKIGKRMAIAKQNMTTIIDKLMQDGLVERKNDMRDRRVINIVITDKGIAFLGESLLALKKIIKKNLAMLGDEDIELLDAAFQTIKTLTSKLDKGDRNASD